MQKINNNRFSILKKCKTKFDCLVFEMFFINELRPSLDVQSDSLRAKSFWIALLIRFYCCCFFSACFISFFYHFPNIFIVLNIFLHLTHIYVYSFNFFFYLLKNYRKLVETLLFIRDFYCVKCKRIKWKNILFWEKSPAICSWKCWIHWKSEDNIFVSLNKTKLVKWRTSYFYLCELSTAYCR